MRILRSLASAITAVGAVLVVVLGAPLLFVMTLDRHERAAGSEAPEPVYPYNDDDTGHDVDLGGEA